MSNKREYFRVNIFNVKIRIENEIQRMNGRIRDISGNGISIYTTKELKEEEPYVIEFELKEEYFILATRLVRKEPKIDGEFIYAFTYENIEPKEQEKLMKILFQMEIMRKN